MIAFKRPIILGLTTVADCGGASVLAAISTLKLHGLD
jgi:hypothetical protein